MNVFSSVHKKGRWHTFLKQACKLDVILAKCVFLFCRTLELANILKSTTPIVKPVTLLAKQEQKSSGLPLKMVLVKVRMVMPSEASLTVSWLAAIWLELMCLNMQSTVGTTAQDASTTRKTRFVTGTGTTMASGLTPWYKRSAKEVRHTEPSYSNENLSFK